MDIINRASKNFDEKNHKAETEPEPFRHTKRTDITKKTALKKNLKMQAILLLKSEKKKKSLSIIFRLFSC